MGKKGGQSYERKQKHLSPFTFSKSDWKEDEHITVTVKIDPPKGSANNNNASLKLEDKFFVLDVSASPEMYIIWWKDVLDKILKRPTIPFEDRLSVLPHIVTGETKMVVSEAIEQTGKDTSKHKREWKIAKDKIKELLTDGLTPAQISNNDSKTRVEAFVKGESIKLKQNVHN